MKVFDDMDKEQAAMYRWIRRQLTSSMYMQLTGKTAPADILSLSVDHELREAFLRYAYHDVMNSLEERSKIRQGLLPPTLGAALLKYTTAVEECVLFQEGLGGETFGDVNRRVEETMRELCDEMAKLR